MGYKKIKLEVYCTPENEKALSEALSKCQSDNFGKYLASSITYSDIYDEGMVKFLDEENSPNTVV